MRTDHQDYSVVIIEDDPNQQELVTGLLRRHNGDFILKGIAANIEEGLDLLTRHQPDLVIMDVLLPPHDCFELLKSLKTIPFKVIFTTSHDEFAIRAFRLSAIDYLLKPLDPSEFHLAIEKFKNKVEEEDNTARIHNMVSNAQIVQADHARIALPTLTGFIFMPVRDILRCESDNTYTTFFTVDKRKVVVSRTLKECEHLLQGFRFFRVHYSHLVNLNYVTEYIKGEGGVVRMTDGSSIDVSRRRKDEFLHQLHTP